MPPVRVPIKNTTAARTRNLFAYGFKGSSAVGKKAVADEVDSSESIGGGRAIEKSEAIASQGVDGSSVPLEAAAEEAPAPTLAAAPAAVSPPPLRRPLKKPLYKGIRHAEFCDDRHEWEGKYHEQIGTSTRKITLGSSFVLTDTHISDILSLGPKVCSNLTDFIFILADVSYSAHNSASSLTDEAIIRFTQACPKLKKVQLQGANNLTDKSLAAFLAYCPDLTFLELTKDRGSGHPTISGAVFDAAQRRPRWGAQLRKLILPRNDNQKFMKAMRGFSKEREGLRVELVHVSEEKKWGDWQLEKLKQAYVNGRVVQKMWR